jgi:UDP-N-acetylglucosamine 2-epimerase (non-hydrolysing)
MAKKVLIVIGTRPNFIKVTQFKKVVKNYSGIDLKIVHTGQHYDDKMADVFFKQFDLIPDYFLNILPGSPNSQIAEIMMNLEKLMISDFIPDLLIVVGDVNSTLAASLTANKMGIKLGHIESGLRSFDHSMPEEHNRIITDKLSDLFFVTEQSGYDNLVLEGIDKEKIIFVGNTMIDTMVAFEKDIDNSNVLNQYVLSKNDFVLMTMHRPATVDNYEELHKLYALIADLTIKYKVFFSIHPRTLKRIEEFGLKAKFLANPKIILADPLGYFDFQKLVKECQFIITDSGGIQEESTFLGKPCLTLRPNTERPVTVAEGTNTLVPFELDIIKNIVSQIESGIYKKGRVPKLWDGKSTERILNYLSNQS